MTQIKSRDQRSGVGDQGAYYRGQGAGVGGQKDRRKKDERFAGMKDDVINFEL